MRFAPVLTVAAMAAASFAGAAPSQTSAVALWHEWMTPGTEFVYQAEDGESSATFSIVVASIGGGVLDTRWDFAQGEVVRQALFRDSDRTFTSNADVSAFTWIHPGDIDAGMAVLAHETTVYEGVSPEGHVFSSENFSYVFHPLSLYLLRMESKWSSASIDLLLRTSRLSVPAPTHGSHTPDLLVLGQPTSASSMSAAGSPETVECYASAPGPLVQPWPLFPDAQCSNVYHVTGRNEVQGVGLDIGFLNSGNGSVEPRAPSDAIHSRLVCEHPLPKLDADPDDCRPDPQYGIVAELPHGVGRLDAFIDYDLCLDPAAFYECHGRGVLQALGEVIDIPG